MKFTSLSGKLADLCISYHAASDAQADAYRAANRQFEIDTKSGHITPDYARERRASARRKADDEFKARSVELNTSLTQSITSLRAEVERSAAPTRPADHAARVLAAMKFLEAEGAGLTDKTAASILKEFIGGRDYETLEKFHRLIEHQVNGQLSDSYGRTIWPVTFGELYNYRAMMNSFADLEGITGKMFLHNRPLANLDNTLNADGYLPADGYNQPLAEATAPEKLNAVETMVTAFFSE